MDGMKTTITNEEIVDASKRMHRMPVVPALFIIESMTPGLRKLKSASLRVAVPMGLPSEMRPHIRELIDVRATNPRKGHASALLGKICKEADRDHWTLIVQVKAFDDSGLTDEQLQKFYSKFSFTMIQTEPVVLMARSPQ